MSCQHTGNNVGLRVAPEVSEGGEKGGQHHDCPKYEHICPASTSADIAFRRVQDLHSRTCPKMTGHIGRAWVKA